MKRVATRVATRAMCATCLRAQSACICGWIRPVEAQAELLILQHPLEVGNAKNSARLLHLCVRGSSMVVGEAFDGAELDGLLRAHGRTPVLLYPDTAGDQLLPTPPLMPALPATSLRLVLLDATWRKSRKMLYLNPALQRLPRLALQEVAPSNYRIRKAHAQHQLSSLEAAARALGQLEGSTEIEIQYAFEFVVEIMVMFCCGLCCDLPLCGVLGC